MNDGVEPTREFEIEARLGGQTRRLVIAAAQSWASPASTGLRPHIHSRLNCATRACAGDNAPGSTRLSLLDGGAISHAAIAPPYRPLAVARADYRHHPVSSGVVIHYIWTKEQGHGNHGD
jgi:hypothetical protein